MIAARIEFKIAEVADGNDAALRRSILALKFVHTDKFQSAFQFGPGHSGGFDRATIVLAKPFEVFLGQGSHFGWRSLLAQGSAQVSNRHAPMPGVQPIGQASPRTAQSRHPWQWQRLEEFHHPQTHAVEQAVHGSTKADLADAVMEVLCSAQDFDLHPHEIDGQIPPIDLWKAHRVLLGGDDGCGLAFLASVDHVQDFLLSETMMIGEALGVNQFRALCDQAFLEALRLGNAAQGSHLAALQKLQTELIACKNILEIERMMNALNNSRDRIISGDSGPQAGGVAVALGNENGAGARQMSRRLPQLAARQQALGAEGLLAIDEHDITAAARQLPVLKSIVEQERVATEFLDGITPALDPVL